jgi:hypothetical protein
MYDPSPRNLTQRCTLSHEWWRRVPFCAIRPGLKVHSASWNQSGVEFQSTSWNLGQRIIPHHETWRKRFTPRHEWWRRVSFHVRKPSVEIYLVHDSWLWVIVQYSVPWKPVQRFTWRLDIWCRLLCAMKPGPEIHVIPWTMAQKYFLVQEYGTK